MATLIDRIDTEARPDARSLRHEAKLVELLDGLWEEGRLHRERVSPVKRRERDRQLYRGEVGPEGAQECTYKLNFTQAFIDRQVAQLTDNRPVERVEARKAKLRSVARVEESLCRQDWDAYDMQRQNAMVAKHAALEGAAGLLTIYDPRTDDPVVLKLLRIGDMVVDPAVTIAARVCSDAEYFGYQEIWTIDQIHEAFPGRGLLVKPDTALEDLTPTGLGYIATSALKWLQREERTGSHALPRAVLRTMFVKDRQKAPNGERLFPGGRLVIYGGDVILWDGPSIYWDGEWPVDLFEWETDPEHVYGHSGVSLLRESQLAFDALMDSTVDISIRTNVMTFLAEHGALDREGWARLNKLQRTNVMKVMTRGARLDYVPPPPIAQDRLALAKSIMTYAQMVTGVMDVTLGESPGSLQSGLAIEGLQEGANLMTRDRASRMEDFYARIGQKLIARHMQFMNGDMVMALLGETPDTAEWVQFHKGFFLDEQSRGVSLVQIMQALKEFKFGVLPGSSAPGSRRARAQMMGLLAEKGLVPSWMVLDAAGIPNGRELAEEGQAEMMKKAPMMQALKGVK